MWALFPRIPRANIIVRALLFWLYHEFIIEGIFYQQSWQASAPQWLTQAKELCFFAVSRMYKTRNILPTKLASFSAPVANVGKRALLFCRIKIKTVKVERGI